MPTLLKSLGALGNPLGRAKLCFHGRNDSCIYIQYQVESFPTPILQPKQREEVTMDEFWEFLRLNAALLVSICALFITVNSAWATRRHNRLMVRPRLTSFTTVETDAATRVTSTTFTLTNSGLGPAIIRTYEVFQGGERIPATTPAELGDGLKLATGVPFSSNKSTFSLLKRGFVMAKDEERNLAVVHVVNMTTEHNEALRKLKLRVTYESAYGESFVYDTDDHLEQSKS